jgi:hypothetical protein
MCIHVDNVLVVLLPKSCFVSSDSNQYKNKISVSACWQKTVTILVTLTKISWKKNKIINSHEINKLKLQPIRLSPQ